MKKVNFPLVFGTFIMVILVVIILFGDNLAPQDPYAMNLGGTYWENGLLMVNRPPFPPGEDNLLGTDILGRDILSYILAGAKTTFYLVFLTTLLRFIIAIPLSFLAAFGEKISQKLIKFFSTIFTAIPSLIICLIILNFYEIRALQLKETIIAYAIVLSIVEWGRLANILTENIKGILQLNFIEGEVAIGKSKLLISLENVLPHLIPSIIVYIFLEAGRVLLILSQLGIFGTYAGKEVAGVNMLNLAITPSSHPEWASMLASARYGITSGHLWVFVFPALAFAISIIGFNLIGEGLNYELSKRNSMVITRIKRLGFHLNPNTYIYEIKNYRRYKKNLAIKTIAIIIIILMAIPSGPNTYQLDNVAVFNHVVEISKDNYEGRLVGTHGQDEFANYIVSQLKLSNIEPLFDGEYIQEFSVDEFPDLLDSADLFINDENGELISDFAFRRDFDIDTWFYTSNENNEDKVSPHNIIGALSGEIMYLPRGRAPEFDPDKEYFVLLGDSFTRRPINSLNNLGKIKNIKAAIVPIESSRTLDSQYFIERKESITFANLDMSEPPLPAIFVNKETAEKIRKLEGNNITIKPNLYNPNNITGKNIGGIIKGKTSENPIVITSSYDYLGSDDTNHYLGLYNNGTSVATILEMAKGLAEVNKQPDRTVIFLFLDSSKFNSKGAERFLDSNITDENPLYLYLRYLGIRGHNSTTGNYIGNHLYLDSSYVSSEEESILGELNQLKANAFKRDLSISETHLAGGIKEFDTLRQKSASHLIIQGISRFHAEGLLYAIKEDDIEMIDSKLLGEQAQLLFDTLINILYGKN